MHNNASVTKPTKPNYNVWTLLILGLIFHFFYIGTLFDGYFTNPVVHGTRRYNVGYAEAKRLVLIVGDGLRADLLFNVDTFPTIHGAPKIVAPYLRTIAETRGAFGISHTHFPTESRLGHAAIIGGVYEGASAIIKGWNTNPVEFDSVFNQSSHTFSFGSANILDIFALGATPLGAIKTRTKILRKVKLCYATPLDLWVLNQLQILFRNATIDEALNSQLRSEKVVFFLHLLGLDTTGHSYRPHSREYMNNIRVVDDLVRQAEETINNFFGDKETSFIFTADHGMSVIGNHGDGNPDNTRTPIVAWGKGVRGPLPDSTPSSHDAYSEPWQLGHLLRRDIEQADIATLMASLLGIDWPYNLVGVLPDADPTRPGYLQSALGDEALARAALVNARVILEHYQVNHELKKAHTLFYKPFKPLENLDLRGVESHRTTAVDRIGQLIRDRKWTAARSASADLIQSALKGLQYLNTYERDFIRGMVMAAYIGWAAYASLYVFRPLDRITKDPSSLSASLLLHVVFVGIVATLWALFVLQKASWTFYVYIVFPCFFWHRFLTQMLRSTSVLTQLSRASCIRALLFAFAVISALQAMVAAYTHRFIWTIGFISIGIVWPMTWPKEQLRKHAYMCLAWAMLCLVGSIFPLLSVQKKEDLSAILAGGISILICGLFALPRAVKKDTPKKARNPLIILFVIQLALIALMIIITTSSVRSLQARRGLPMVNRVLGWITLVVATALPVISNGLYHTAFSAFLAFFLGFGPCFVILSISVEGLYYVVYSALLGAWVLMESVARSDVVHTPISRHSKQQVYRFQPDDIRVALFFLFFVQVGFFGVGNVASTSSFYPEPICRLVPTFSPFLIIALLIFKIVAPYVILAVSAVLLNDILHLPPFSVLLLALILTDGMTITFFFNVHDSGSWLKIGQSINFFCIASLLVLWSTGICATGECFFADVLTRIHTKQK